MQYLFFRITGLIQGVQNQEKQLVKSNTDSKHYDGKLIVIRILRIHENKLFSTMY